MTRYADSASPGSPSGFAGSFAPFRGRGPLPQEPLPQEPPPQKAAPHRVYAEVPSIRWIRMVTCSRACSGVIGPSGSYQ
mgnify:CR=1 FL=1